MSTYKLGNTTLTYEDENLVVSTVRKMRIDGGDRFETVEVMRSDFSLPVATDELLRVLQKHYEVELGGGAIDMSKPYRYVEFRNWLGLRNGKSYRKRRA